MSDGPAYQALVLACQAATFGGLAVWFVRCTRPGRDLSKAIAWLALAPRRRRARQRQAAVQEWQAAFTWWMTCRRQYEPGTRQYETANDMINYLLAVKPGPCPHDGFTCDRPRCPHHPRSVQS